jgi:hypothetical protein
MATTKSKSTKSRTSKTKATKSAKSNENQSNLEVVVVKFPSSDNEYSYLALKEWGIKAGDTAIVQTQFNPRAKVSVVRVIPHTPDTRATKMIIGKEFVQNTVVGADLAIIEVIRHLVRLTKDNGFDHAYVKSALAARLAKS